MKRFSQVLLAAAVGLIDPNCTLQKICTPGYTKTVRPKSGYTSQLKRSQIITFQLSGNPGEFEEDHIIPLELCGHPFDPRNLIPQPWDRARKKDVLETRFHRLVCRGDMTLEEAQKQIVTFE
jgi:hypothetical protein